MLNFSNISPDFIITNPGTYIPRTSPIEHVVYFVLGMFAMLLFVEVRDMIREYKETKQCEEHDELPK